ncbi:MAG TPA: hypothetical protein VMU80_13275 [Bryobacteraceae bacterium]|nr:hypothetical protein [Bryobacteraceae bacterium]
MSKRILILFVLAAAWIAPEDLSSCGPFLPEAVFTSRAAPLDEVRYFSGHLDILQPQYRRIYLMPAYRYITGVGLSKADQVALMKPPTGPDLWFNRDTTPVAEWLHARVIIGAPPLAHIDQFKWQSGSVYILNCGDDAFRNAAGTLDAHMQAGDSHDDLRAWVAAQDQVFANCSGPQPWQTGQKAAPPSIPLPLPPIAPAWMRAARAYQIAAAKFYAGQFDDAYADFLRIAADRNSPWHAMAPYLAARALIRKATLADPHAAAAAQAQLEKVVADPEAAPWHASAQGLLGYLRVETDRDAVLGELARKVATQKTDVASVMNDYRIIWDQYESRAKQPPFDDDLTEWIAAMHYTSGDHALARWRATHSLPWLVAALTWASAPDADLMAAAAQVPRTSPGFLTVEFHRTRLLAAADARPRLDAILGGKLPEPARNLFLASRMRLARDWNEMLQFAPRLVTAVENEDGKHQAGARQFDDDAAHILNREAPLSVLLDAARSPSLPPDLQMRVARAVWVRAVLLHDVQTGKAIAPVLASLAPYLMPYLDPYLKAPDDQARQFAATWLLLHDPGMRPWIDAGIGRLTPDQKIDNFRDNWWCPADTSPHPMNAPLELLYRGATPAAGFRSADERAVAQKQWDALAGAPALPTLVAKQTIAWAEAHPDDPRIPESLALVVHTAHYACTGDDATDRWVERAFRLLHGRYPASEAAKRTPLWFKSGRNRFVAP